MKNRKMFIWMSAIVVVLATIYYIGYLKFKKDFEEGFAKTITNILEHPDRVDTWCLAFEKKYSRWPKNIAELKNFIDENKENGNFDLNDYENLTLTETTEKSLKIHYDFNNKGRVANGTYVNNGVYNEELKFDSLKK